MQYSKKIPSTGEVIRLSTLVRSYPVERVQAVRTARSWSMSGDLIAFLRLFPADAMFATRADLVNRCRDMARIIRRKRETPMKKPVQTGLF